MIPKNIPNIAELHALLNQARDGEYPIEVQERLEWLINFVSHGSVSQTCKRFDIARTTFYRWLNRFDATDLHSLTDAPKVQHQPEKVYVVRSETPGFTVQAPEAPKDKEPKKLMSMQRFGKPALFVSILINVSILMFLLGYASYEAGLVRSHGFLTNENGQAQQKHILNKFTDND